MAWEWSHTDDAYINARENLNALSRDDVKIIYSEIKAYQKTEYMVNDAWFKTLKYELARAHKFATNTLIEFIWDFMGDFRTCDNGGFNAWCCPYGCHTVSFDKEQTK